MDVIHDSLFGDVSAGEDGTFELSGERIFDWEFVAAWDGGYVDWVKVFVFVDWFGLDLIVGYHYSLADFRYSSLLFFKHGWFLILHGLLEHLLCKFLVLTASGFEAQNSFFEEFVNFQGLIIVLLVIFF